MRSKLNNLVFYISISILVCSCYINHGNRFPDINFEWQSNISPYYIHKYMNSLDSFYQNRMELTSEIVNFPDRFVPVTDSLRGYKYVIEFDILDSIKSLQSNYFSLASIYDFKKKRWVTDRDDLKDGELKKFQFFFS